jgi:hypothetical protein
VVISPNFLRKEWPQKELDGLVAREVDGAKVILPVWHNIGAEQIRAYSPTLSDRVAVSSNKGLQQVIDELVSAIGAGQTEVELERRQTGHIPETRAVQPSVATAASQLATQRPRPSLVFVFGAPLGDNDSASWIMMLKHYGPETAYNCDIVFYDDDRKNIEHEWLVKHPDSPYPPPGLAGESQRSIQVQEAGPEGSIANFVWNPLDPNSQHYTVSISCRDGYFVEKWEVARVNGILRSAITIERGAQWVEKNPGKESVLFRHRDPEFVPTALATEMPKAPKGKVVHPGWKPQYRFPVPAAISDPNGNVQTVSGVKQPDGSTLTDFGSWNILTKHFGDKPD